MEKGPSDENGGGEMTGRAVDGDIFRSRDPRIAVRIDADFHFIGRLTFDLHGSADVDTFLFADAETGRYRRRLAIHFEQYRARNDYTYDFPSAEEMVLGAHAYVHDAFFGRQARLVEETPEADFARVEMFLRDRGLPTWEEAMWQRFMRTVDRERRAEILFLYHEDLSPTGLTVSQLEGREADCWPGLATELRHRALGAFEVLGG